MKRKEAIENILDHFDFERVHKAMVALDWKWALLGDVPEIPDLRKKARELLKEVSKRKEDGYTIGTGGFQVHKGNGILELKFVLAEWDEEIEIK